MLHASEVFHVGGREHVCAHYHDAIINEDRILEAIYNRGQHESAQTAQRVALGGEALPLHPLHDRTCRIHPLQDGNGGTETETHFTGSRLEEEALLRRCERPDHLVHPGHQLLEVPIFVALGFGVECREHEHRLPRERADHWCTGQR